MNSIVRISDNLIFYFKIKKLTAEKYVLSISVHITSMIGKDVVYWNEYTSLEKAKHGASVWIGQMGVKLKRWETSTDVEKKEVVPEFQFGNMKKFRRRRYDK